MKSHLQRSVTTSFGYWCFFRWSVWESQLNPDYSISLYLQRPVLAIISTPIAYTDLRHLPLPSGQDWCCGDHLGNDALSLLEAVLGQHGIKDRRCDLLSCFSSYEPLRLRLQTCFLGSAAFFLMNGSCRDRFRSRSRSPARCMAAQGLLCATCFSKQWLHWCGTRPSWSQIIPPSVLRLMLCRRLDAVSCQESSHHCHS